MKLSTILKVLVGLILLIVGAIGVFIATLDVSQYKGRIVALIEENTGRSVAIDGEMDLAIGLTPALVVEGVTIGNAPWAQDSDMVTVGRLEAQVELIPLISGDINVVRLVLVEPVVNLETNAEGEGNWVLAGPTDEAAPDEDAAETAAEDTADATEEGGPGDTGAAPNLQIQEVRLENGALVYRDGVSGQTMSVALERVSLTGGGLTDPLTLDIAGAYNEAAFTLAGTVGALTALNDPGSSGWPLDLEATAGGATVTVNGSIADPAAAKGIDLAVTVRGSQVADLAALAQAAGQTVDIPALGPYSVALKVQGDADALSVSDLDAGLGSPDAFRVAATGAIANALAPSGLDLTLSVNVPDPDALADLGATLPVPLKANASVMDIEGGYGLRDLAATLGRSSVTGSLDARLDGPRPAVSGQLSSPLLDLNELSGSSGPGADSGSGSDGGAATGNQATAGGPMIPDTPLPLDALTLADADLTIGVDTAVLPGGAEVSGLTLGITLNRGALAISPMQATVAGGSLSGSVGLEPVGNGAASVAVELSGEGVRLGDLAKTFGGSDALTEGPSTIRVQLTGRGATPHEIAGTLDGSVLLHTVDARINNGAVNWAGGDVFTQLGSLVNPFAQKEDTTPVQCLVFNMSAADGVLTNDNGIAMETDKMVVGGGGAIDLGEERLSVRIAPRPRPGIGLETGFGKIVELFAVTGPFANPSLELDAEKALETGLRTAASAAGAVATGGLSLLGESLLVSEDGEMEPCLVALGEKEPGTGGGGAADAGSGEAASDPVSGAAEDIGRAVEGIIGGGSGGGSSDGGATDGGSDGGGSDDVGGAIREGIGGLLGN
ncbi:AsmA family protein [Roseospira navarrensis]|uniref:AsmA family protein n=1 Tax=Roseospira navarrensis TaxID=140058 RepID=A0A7X2D3N4_9PROT|nr:AsmA family protein [Roseospira navarrensis]MQX36998.1 AsmA family protein [Roseospira navarrensis]